MGIRKIKKREFKEVVKIYRDVFSEEPYNENWTLSEAKKKIKIFSKYCDIWVYIMDKNILGFLIVNPYHWKIGEIAFFEEIGIRKEFRRKNIATKFMNFVTQYYKKKGFSEIMAIIDKRAKSFGFVKKFKLKIDDLNVIVRKKLE